MSNGRNHSKSQRPRTAADRCAPVPGVKDAPRSTAHGKRASVVEYGGPPPFWNTPPLANPRRHGSFIPAASLRELRAASRPLIAAPGQNPFTRWLAIPALGHSAGGPDALHDASRLPGACQTRQRRGVQWPATVLEHAAACQPTPPWFVYSCRLFARAASPPHSHARKKFFVQSGRP